MDDVAAWGTAIVFIALYWAGYRLIRDSAPLSFRRVVLPAIPLLLISFVTIPYDSTDAFLYMDVGWAQVHYGLNPYSHVLRDIGSIENDPIIRTEWMESNKNPWLDLPFVYGFTFASVVRSVAWLGGGNWWETLAFLKLLNAAAYMATAWLVWLIARVLEHTRPDISVYLFVWSPLILQHHVANAHNDLLVGCFIVVAVYLLVNGRDVLAPSVMVVATLIKYATLPLIPLTLWFLWRRSGWKSVVFATVLAIAVAAALSVPYISEIGQFRFDLIEAQLNKITAGSLYAFLYYVYRLISPSSLPAFALILKIVLWIAGAAAVGYELVCFCRKQKPSVQDLISTCAATMFIVLFVASSQFYSWYIGMLLPLVLLMRSSSLLRAFIIVAGGTHVLSLTSLSRKAIGYFLLTTGSAAALVQARKKP